MPFTTTRVSEIDVEIDVNPTNHLPQMFQEVSQPTPLSFELLSLLWYLGFNIKQKCMSLCFCIDHMHSLTNLTQLTHHDQVDVILDFAHLANMPVQLKYCFLWCRLCFHLTKVNKDLNGRGIHAFCTCLWVKHALNQCSCSVLWCHNDLHQTEHISGSDISA